jgi:aspartyl-tRNA(Asn)/glutamyl-tRNA(Gln) amidotransferase subunit C
MKLDKKTIKMLTQLSRIHCSEEEEEALLKDLQKILTYVEQLNEIDTSNVPPCNQVIPGMANRMREDVVGEKLPRERFLENAPQQIGGLIRVPTVLKTKS